jgi:molybdopterin converting factor small subunit
LAGDAAVRINLRAYGDLMAPLGRASTVELPAGARVTDLIPYLVDRVGRTRPGYLGRYYLDGDDLLILLNGRNLRTLDGLETPLRDDDTVVLLPPVIGG